MPKKKTNVTQTFSVAVHVDSRKLKNSHKYNVQIRVTGGQWLGKVARAAVKLLRWPVLTTGAAVATAALARQVF